MTEYRWDVSIDLSTSIKTKTYTLHIRNGIFSTVAGKVIHKNIWGMYRAVSEVSDVSYEMKNFAKLSDAKRWVEEKAGIVKRKKKAKGSEWHPFGL